MARAKSREPGPRSGDESSPLLERDGMIGKEELARFLDVPEGDLVARALTDVSIK